MQVLVTEHKDGTFSITGLSREQLAQVGEIVTSFMYGGTAKVTEEIQEVQQAIPSREVLWQDV